LVDPFSLKESTRFRVLTGNTESEPQVNIFDSSYDLDYLPTVVVLDKERTIY
jgi:hypothetical protein